MSTILRSLTYIKNRALSSGYSVHNHAKNTVFPTCQYYSGANASVQRDVLKNAGIGLESYKNYIDNRLGHIDRNLKTLGRTWRSDVESILIRVKDTGDLNNIQALLLLRCCGSAIADSLPHEKMYLADEVWNMFKRYNIPLDISHYNTLLQVYLENDFDFSPTDILKQMQDNNITPNKITYQRLIEYYCRQGNIGNATKVLECLKGEGLPLTEAIFNSLIKGYSITGDMESANGILEVMKANFVEPSGETYTALMCAYAKRNEFEQIKRILENCEKQNIFISNKNILDVIYTLAVNDHVDYVEDMFQGLLNNEYLIDEINFTLKLLDAKKTDLAVKLFLQILPKIRNTFLLISSVKPFMQKMALIKEDFNRILDVSKLMENNRLPLDPASVSLQHLLSTYDVNECLNALKIYHTRGYKLKPHYFWPVLTKTAQKHDFQGTLDILRFMVQECNTIPCIDTIKDFVLPYSFGGETKVYNMLKEHNVPEMVINNALVHSFIYNKKLKKAVNYMLAKPGEYSYTVIDDVLVYALVETRDIYSFLQICFQLTQKPDAQTSSNGEGLPASSSPVPLEEMILHIAYIRPYEKRLLIEVIKQMGTKRYSLSPATVQIIMEHLGESVTPEVNNMFEGSATESSMSNVLEFDYLHDEIVSRKAKMLHTIHLERLLFSKLENLKDSDLASLPKKYIVFLIKFACKCNDIELVERYLEKIQNFQGKYYLSSTVNLTYAILLVKANRFEDAIKYISENRATHGNEQLSQKLSLQLLSYVSLRCNKQQIQDLLDLLIASKYMNFIGNSSTIHEMYTTMAKDELQKDVGKYFSGQDMQSQHRIQLMTRLIQMENHDLLQKVIDYSSKEFGKSETLLYLLFAFLDCNRQTAAVKILADSDVFMKPKHLMDIAKEYVESGNARVVESLLDITKHNFRINRKEIYSHLLTIYEQKNLWDKGLNLWMKMQEENMIPTRAFLSRLAILLINNEQNVPFVYDVDYVNRKVNKVKNIETVEPPMATVASSQ